MKGQHGIPRIYHVKYKDRAGNLTETTTWYADVWTRGRRRRVALGGPSREDAADRLKRILADPSLQSPPERGKLVLGVHVAIPRSLKRLADLFDLVRSDYQREHYASARHLETKIGHVHRVLGNPDIEDVDNAAVHAFQDYRLKEGAAPGTVQLETGTIRRGFTLARERGILHNTPKLPYLRVQNARQGFYLRADFERIVAALPWHWRPFAWAAYHTGWRPKELLTRQWRHVDLERGWMRLEPAESKNGHGRETPIVPELLAILRTHREACVALEKRVDRIIPWVNFSLRFHGKRLKVYAGVWIAARNAAGMPRRLLYDCRRTRVRNLERAGVSRTAGREWVGHRDPRIFDRYAIVDETMMREAVVKAAAFEKQLRKEAAASSAGKR